MLESPRGAPAPSEGAPALVTRPRASRAVGRRPLWLMAPGLLLMVLVILLPLALAAWMALTDLDQYTLRDWVTAPYVGLANVREAFASAGLLHSIVVSTSFAVLTTLFTLPIGLAAAVSTSAPFRGRGLVRSVYLVPYVLPSFVTGTIWRTFLQRDGVVNSALAGVGVDGGQWLIGGRSFWTLVLVDTWAAWPFIYLLSLAGLQTIAREVHEAAAVDGTSWWQKMRFVILPELRGPLGLAVVIATLSHINNFSLPFLLFGNPAPHAANVLPLLTYTTSFTTFRFGLGSAMALAALALIAIPMVAYLRAVRLDTGDDPRDAR